MIGAQQCQVMANLWSKRSHELREFLPRTELYQDVGTDEETPEESFQRFQRIVQGLPTQNGPRT